MASFPNWYFHYGFWGTINESRNYTLLVLLISTFHQIFRFNHLRYRISIFEKVQGKKRNPHPLICKISRSNRPNCAINQYEIFVTVIVYIYLVVKTWDRTINQYEIFVTITDYICLVVKISNCTIFKTKNKKQTF